MLAHHALLKGRFAFAFAIAFALLLLEGACALPSKETGGKAATPAAAAAIAASTKTLEAAHKNVEFPEEDSDMLMEPNDFTPITVLRSHEQHYHMPPTTTTTTSAAAQHFVHPQQLQQQQQQQHSSPSRTIQTQQQQQQQLAHQTQFRPIPNPNINTQILAPRADVNTAGVAAPLDSHTQAAQNFYPPFYREAPPLGHSRPYFPLPDGAPLAKYIGEPLEVPVVQQQQQQQQQQQAQQRGFDAAILGSGDFGVLRGGTFYPEEEMPYHPEDNSDYIYGDAANNGHGRPTEGFIQKYTYPEEQFANFRDFADINTPADSAFSQFVVVYAAKNATKPQTHPHPKNIFEQLELLDREKALEEAAGAATAANNKNKNKNKLKQQRPSKSKSKLSKTKLQKKYKKKSSPKDVDLEPLLALS